MPVLWDKKKNTIVNNESADIVRMLNDRMNKIAKNVSFAGQSTCLCVHDHIRSCPAALLLARHAHSKVSDALMPCSQTWIYILRSCGQPLTRSIHGHIQTSSKPAHFCLTAVLLSWSTCYCGSACIHAAGIAVFNMLCLCFRSNGVYRCGFAQGQQAYEGAFK